MLGGTQAMREDHALQSLKRHVSVPVDAGANTDLYLLRFLRSVNLNSEEAVAKLKNRRKFERSFIALSVTPYLVRALRSGAFAVIGNDVMNRPVLYIRMAYHRPSDDPLENEKLAIVLLEYMASLAFAGGVQEITILVNEQGAGWFAHHDSIHRQTLTRLMENNFPGFVALVLVADAAWTVAAGMKSKLSDHGSKSKTKLQFVAKADLPKYLHSSVIPQELAGRNKVAMAMQELAESVMRYWYSSMGVLQGEHEGQQRPLWQQLSSVSTLPQHLLRERRALASRGARRETTRSRAQSQNRGFGGATTSGGGGSAGGSQMDTTTDDGVCSMISESDLALEFGDTESTEQSGSRGVNPSAAFSNGGEDMRMQLEAERQRRLKLEHEVSKLRLGVAISDDQLTPLEARLKQIHEEVNILVGEAVVRTREHSGPRGPTLGALLEVVDSAILHEVQDRQPVPAMHFAHPTERKPKSSCTAM